MCPMFARRILTLLLAGWFLAVAAGLPLEVRLPVAKVVDSGEVERFPCETCPCGCATADYCWKKCCCHSLAARLAWARREGVRPPQHAIAAAKAAGLDTTPWNEPPSQDGLVLASFVENKASQQCANCPKKRCHKNSTAKVRLLTFKPVIVLHAIACQGMTSDGTFLVATPPPAPTELPVSSRISDLFVIKVLFYTALAGKPLLPPPQICVAELS